MVYNVTVKNRIIVFNSANEDTSGEETEVVGGNKGDIVYFALDDEWTSIMSTTEVKASFVWRSKYHICDIETDENGNAYCYAPPIFNSNSFYLGIYVGEDINDPNYMSTTKVEIPCRLSIRDYMTSPQDDYGKNYTDEAKYYASIAKNEADRAEESEAEAKSAADRAEEAAERAEEAAERAESAVENGPVGGVTIDLDTTLTQSGKAADAKATGDRLTAVEKKIADLTYEPIKITSFTMTATGLNADETEEVTLGATNELGVKVMSVRFNWALDRAAQKVTLNGTDVTGSTTYSTSPTGGITADKSFTLTATDERGTNTTATQTLRFYNGVYYGAAAEPTTIDSAFVKTLTKTLRGSKLTSFNATAGSGQYIWYCLPKRMGTCAFKVGGFDGGFSLVDTISFTNASGYTEDYYIYRSDNASLGSTSVSVS